VLMTDCIALIASSGSDTCDGDALSCCDPANQGLVASLREWDRVPSTGGTGSGFELVIAEPMACGCHENVLSFGQVGDYREVVGGPYAADRCIAAEPDALDPALVVLRQPHEYIVDAGVGNDAVLLISVASVPGEAGIVRWGIAPSVCSTRSGTAGAASRPPSRRSSSEVGSALRSPVTTGGYAQSPACSATNPARARTCSSRIAEPPGRYVRCVVTNGSTLVGAATRAHTATRRSARPRVGSFNSSTATIGHLVGTAFPIATRPRDAAGAHTPSTTAGLAAGPARRRGCRPGPPTPPADRTRPGRTRR
jgi:hypothetical protein